VQFNYVQSYFKVAIKFSGVISICLDCGIHLPKLPILTFLLYIIYISTDERFRDTEREKRVITTANVLSINYIIQTGE